MITMRNKTIGGLLLNIKLRKAGSMEKDGKQVVWDDAHQITYVPFEEERNIKKATIKPSCVDEIVKKLDSVHWGALIELELSNNLVTDVVVVEDVLADFYENN